MVLLLLRIGAIEVGSRLFMLVRLGHLFIIYRTNLQTRCQSVAANSRAYPRSSCWDLKRRQRASASETAPSPKTFGHAFASQRKPKDVCLSVAVRRPLFYLYISAAAYDGRIVCRRGAWTAPGP